MRSPLTCSLPVCTHFSYARCFSQHTQSTVWMVVVVGTRQCVPIDPFTTPPPHQPLVTRPWLHLEVVHYPLASGSVRSQSGRSIVRNHSRGDRGHIFPFPLITLISSPHPRRQVIRSGRSINASIARRKSDEFFVIVDG